MEKGRGGLINAIVKDENESLSSIANIDHSIGQEALSGEPGADLKLGILEKYS